jgi:hypothetical protein
VLQIDLFTIPRFSTTAPQRKDISRADRRNQGRSDDLIVVSGIRRGKMGTKLPVTTGARRLSLRPLAITAMLVAGLAITASGAPAKKGVWTVRPGHTLHLTNMAIEAAPCAGCKPWDEDTAYLYIDGVQGAQLASNVGSTNGADHPPDSSYINPDPRATHTVTLDLRDFTHVCDSFSFGPNAVVNGHLSGLALFAIHDGSSPGCGTSPLGTGTQADFFGNVTLTVTP